MSELRLCDHCRRDVEFSTALQRVCDGCQARVRAAYEPQRSSTRKYTIIVDRTGAPIPFRGWDWEAHVDGNEERGSCLGETKWEAVRALIDQLEADEDDVPNER